MLPRKDKDRKMSTTNTCIQDWDKVGISALSVLKYLCIQYQCLKWRSLRIHIIQPYTINRRLFAESLPLTDILNMVSSTSRILCVKYLLALHNMQRLTWLLAKHTLRNKANFFFRRSPLPSNGKASDGDSSAWSPSSGCDFHRWCLLKFRATRFTARGTLDEVLREPLLELHDAIFQEDKMLYLGEEVTKN